MTLPTSPPPRVPVPTSAPPPMPPPGWRAPRDEQVIAPVAPPDKKRVLRVELAVMAFAAAVPGLVIGLRGIGEAESVDTDIEVLELIAVVASAFGTAAIATYLLWRDGSLGVAGFARRRLGFMSGWGVVGFLCCVGALLVVANVLSAIIAVFGGDLDSTADTPDIDLTWGWAVIAIVISITAGVTEEVIYRAYAITRMEQAGWPRAAVVVPLLVWAAQHLYAGPVAPLAIAAVGAPLVWLYRWKRSLWPVVIAHTLYDIAVFMLNAAQS